MAAGDAARRRVFRQLLRAASASVRFARPAARSVRKLVREDVEHATPALDAPQPTLTLFLLSALYERPIVQPAQRGAPVWRPDSDSDAARLAHRCVANLASLTYHHLSPNTAMQRKRAGGSSTSTAPRKQSVVNEAFAEMDAGTTDTAGGMHLHVLHVAPKPVRGPVGSKPMYWDAQHPEKHLANVEDHGEMERLERHVEELAEQYATLVAQLGAAHAQTKAAKTKLVDLRGSLKGMRKMAANRRTEAVLAQCPKDALVDVVKGLAHAERLCLGVPRWQRWRDGGYLAP